jgi:type III secretion protein R
MTPSIGSDPVTLIGFLAALALLPLAFIVGTSFLKFSIVLMVVRNAIGVQQVPPQMALYALALVLTGFVMAPVGYQMADVATDETLQGGNSREKLEAAQRILEPWKHYLVRNTSEDALETFIGIAKAHWPAGIAQAATTDNILIVLPSFTISELKRAFEIGFLLYIPFIVIDVVVSNILLALGMQMVAPMTFSTPLKLLLFVSVDGWTRLLTALSSNAV